MPTSPVFEKNDIRWPQQPLTEKVSDISEKLDFWWSIPQKGTGIGQLGSRDDQTIRISNFFDEMRLLRPADIIFLKSGWWNTNVQSSWTRYTPLSDKIIGPSTPQSHLLLLVIQWIFDLRKFLGTAKNFLKSKIFLKSNTPSSLKYANWKYYIYFYDPIY